MLQPSGSCVAACVPLSARARVSSGSGIESLSAVMVRVTGEVALLGIVSVPLPVSSESSSKLAPLSAVMVISPLEMPSPVISRRSIAWASRSLSKLRARLVLAPSLMLPSAEVEKAKTLSLAGMVMLCVAGMSTHPAGKTAPSAARVMVTLSAGFASESSVMTRSKSADAEPCAMVTLPVSAPLTLPPPSVMVQISGRSTGATGVAATLILAVSPSRAVTRLKSAEGGANPTVSSAGSSSLAMVMS